MIASKSAFAAGLRLSPRPVLVALLVLALPLLPGARVNPGEFADRAAWLFLAILFIVPAGWWLAGLRPALAPGYTLAALVALLACLVTWLPLPGMLALVAVPVVLAGPLAGVATAAVTAAGESALLAGLVVIPGLTAGSIDPVAALVAIWCAFGSVCATYRPIYQLAGWLEDHYRRAGQVLEEAQARRGDIEQLLESVAYANRQLALADERSTTLRRIAEEAERTKTMFVANVSHEFRTPLNMIIGLVELMVESPEIYAVTLPPKMREDLEVVHRNCEHLAGMVNDVLDLTQIDSGRMKLHRERVSLAAVIERAMVVVRPLVDKKGLALRRVMPDGLAEVYCDRVRVQQVILNLLSNAARFTEHGGITVAAAMRGPDVLVSVTDTGPGILAQDVERIFEPFVQSSGDLWRGKGGSGLGLSISRRFIDLHGGSMWVESEPGHGTTFFFTLPLSAPIVPQDRPAGKIREDWVWREPAFVASSSAPHKDLVAPRVVVCEGTGVLFTELARYADGVELVDARDLEQAVQALQDCPAHALLINAADGADAAALAAAAGRVAPGTPVIGCSVPQREARARTAGAMGHLVKPVSRAALLEMLRDATRAAGRPVRRVLIVDDDPEARDLFSRMLRLCDGTLEISQAANGAEALDRLPRGQPDLILLDVVMPDMDGWQLLDRLWQHLHPGEVAVYVVSAQDPADQPPSTSMIVATLDGGVSLNRLLSCSLALAAELLKPERGLDPVPV